MYKFLFFLVFTFILASCNSNDKENNESSESIGSVKGKEINTKKLFSFLSNVQNIVALGKIDFTQIIEKSEAKNDPLINAIIQGPLTSLEIITDNAPIYFGLSLDKGVAIPLNPDDLLDMPLVSPEGSVFLFCSVKNQEELVAVLKKELNLAFEKKDSFFTASNESLELVLDEDILYIEMNLSNSNEKSSKTLFDLVNTSDEKYSTSSNEIDFSKLLLGEEDLVFAYNLEKSVSLAQESLQLLNNEGLALLKADLTNCFNKSSIDFQKGKLVISSENILTERMNKWTVLGKDTKEIVRKLGRENPTAAIALNMDINELQKIVDTYLSGSFIEIGQKFNIPEIGETLESLKGNGLKKYFNGILGVSLYMDQSFIPDFNLYASLGNESMNMLRVPLMDIKTAAAEFKNEGEIILIKSSQKYSRQTEEEYFSDFSNFGNYPFNAFVDLSQIAWSDFFNEKQIINALESFTSIKLWIENDKFTTEINVQNKDQNFLAFFIQKMLKDNLSALFQ